MKEKEEVCVICAETIEFKAKGVCNHITCHICSLRLRALYKQLNCTICKTPLPSVIHSTSDKLFQDFTLSKMPKWDKKLSIYFETPNIYDNVMFKLSFNCPICKFVCNNGWSELKSHVKKSHGRSFCDCCVKFKKVFTHEHSTYTEVELKTHYETGDKNDQSFKGHPYCGFCNSYFYGKDELFEHCKKDHENCFLCKQKNINDIYYQNYMSLEAHFKSDHLICSEPECLEKKFVVFNSDIDLRAHEEECHPQKVKKGKAKKIELNFDYGTRKLDHKRVYSTGGSSNAPPIIQRSNSFESSYHPPKETEPQQEDLTSKFSNRMPKDFGKSLTKPTVEKVDETESSESSPKQNEKSLKPAVQGDPEAIAILQKLLDSDEVKFEQFKTYASFFRVNAISSDEFLLGLVSLSIDGKDSRLKKSIEVDIGRLWNRLMLTLPPDDLVATNNGKGKKKNIPIPLGYSLEPLGKKEMMLKSWNNYKVKNSVDQWENKPTHNYSTSLNRFSEHAESTAPRVLVIKDRGTKVKKSFPAPVQTRTFSASSARTQPIPNNTTWGGSTSGIRNGMNNVSLNTDFPSLPATQKVDIFNYTTSEEPTSNGDSDNISKKKGKKGKKVLLHFG